MSDEDNRKTRHRQVCRHHRRDESDYLRSVRVILEPHRLRRKPVIFEQQTERCKHDVVDTGLLLFVTTTITIVKQTGHAWLPNLFLYG